MWTLLMSTSHKRNKKPAASYTPNQDQKPFSAKLNFTVVINPVHLKERWKKGNPCNSIEQVTKELQAHTDNGVHHNISDCWKISRVECVNWYMPAVEGRKRVCQKLLVCTFWSPKSEQNSNFNGFNTLQANREIKMPPNQSMKAKYRTAH